MCSAIANVRMGQWRRLPLLDHLVGGQKQTRRYRYPERLGQNRACWGFLLTPLLRNLNRNRAHFDWLPWGGADRCLPNLGRAQGPRTWQRGPTPLYPDMRSALADVRFRPNSGHYFQSIPRYLENHSG
jgi:hypothetical protein